MLLAPSGNSETFKFWMSYASPMYEWYYLGLALLVFLIGLGIGVKLLTRSIREQEEYLAAIRPDGG